MAYISVRESIKWGDEDASENTDTVVLTSRNRYFTDIRVYRDAKPNDNGEITDGLEWGFAGTSASTPAEYTHYHGQRVLEKPSHSVWTHWIDSRSTDEVKDEGDMYPQPTGETLEKGEMVNPETGIMTSYEEVWVELEPPAEGFSSHVLILDNHDSRGLLIRVGTWMQGVMRRGNQVSVARWNFDGVWRRLVVIGEDRFPSDALFGIQGAAPTLRERSTIPVGNDVWTCVEAFN